MLLLRAWPRVIRESRVRLPSVARTIGQIQGIERIIDARFGDVPLLAESCATTKMRTSDAPLETSMAASFSTRIVRGGWSALSRAFSMSD